MPAYPASTLGPPQLALGYSSDTFQSPSETPQMLSGGILPKVPSAKDSSAPSHTESVGVHVSFLPPDPGDVNLEKACFEKCWIRYELLSHHTFGDLGFETLNLNFCDLDL